MTSSASPAPFEELAAGISMAPPPTRGWTVVFVPRVRGLIGSPAHAGMDPGFCRIYAVCGGLPRPRGDGPMARLYRRPVRAISLIGRGHALLPRIDIPVKRHLDDA